MLMQAMYERLPVWMQDGVISLAGLQLKRRRYGPKFDAVLKVLQQNDSLAFEELVRLRNRKRSQVLQRASLTPHYAAVFKDMGANWQDFRTDEEFARIPVTEKSALVADPFAFMPRPLVRSDRIMKTSGTTGTPLRFAVSANCEVEQWAVWWRHWGRHGVAQSMRRAILAPTRVVGGGGGGDRPWRLNFASKEIRLSLYHISDRTVKRYFECLEKYSPPWIHAHASALALLADSAKRNGLRLSYKPQVVTVGSTGLAPWESVSIREVFGVYPRQHYGLAEGVANISECPNGALHVDEDFAYVEIVDSPSGGEIVGTSFSNFATVLLRYRTGDLATLGATCECGLAGRVISALQGRSADYLVLPDGRRLTALSTIFNGVKGIGAAQLYQDAGGKITIRIKPTADWKVASRDQVSQSLDRLAGLALNAAVCEVEDVERTASGKVRLVISELTR